MYIKRINVSISTKDVCDKIQAKLIGSEDILISELSSLDRPKANALTFQKGSSSISIVQACKEAKLAAIIVPEDINLEELKEVKTPLLLVKNPHASFLSLIPLFYEESHPEPGIHEKSVIETSAEIDPTAHIGPLTYIGHGVRIGAYSIIHPHCTIYSGASIGSHVQIHSGASIREGVQIDNHVTIQNGAVIGADGFGYIADPELGLKFVPQLGSVHLHQRSELGANSCIDRGTMDSSEIGLGSKVDNLVQIGHNTVVGNHSIICGQSAIAGSVKIGNQVVLGGNVGVADHTEISDGCRFGAFAGASGTYRVKGDYAGNPAIPARLHRRIAVLSPKLPEIIKALKKGLKSKDL